MTLQHLLDKQQLEKEDIIRLLSTEGEEMQQLLKKAREVKFARLDNMCTSEA